MGSLLDSTLNTRFIQAGGKPSVTVRSEQIDACPKSDIERLYALGVRAVVDLRRLKDETPNPYLSECGIEYFNVPIDDIDFDLSAFIDSTGAGDDEFRRNEAIGDFYYYSFKTLYRKEMIRALKIYNRYDGHILIHCTWGKDRTAMISYLIQRYLKATDEEIFDGYLQSAVNLQPAFAEKKNCPTIEKSTAIFKRAEALCRPEPHLFDEFDLVLMNHITE